MAVALGSGGVITVTGTESSLANMNTGAALATGCTLITYGAAPATVRRLALLSAARIILQGTLAWNPENEEFFVSSDVPAGSGSLSDGGGGAFEIQNNGFLDIGGEATGPGTSTTTDDGITYTKGTAISCAELGTGSYAATDIRNAMIYARPGSRVRIRGCTLVSESPVQVRRRVRPLRRVQPGNKGRRVGQRRKQTTNFFAPRIYTDNYTIRNLTMIGGTLQIQARGASASIDGIRPERMAGGIAVPGNNFGTDTDFYTLRGFDGKHNSTQDASVFNAQKLRIRNSRTGSDVNVDLQSLGHTGRSYGCIEVDQESALRLPRRRRQPHPGRALSLQRFHRRQVLRRDAHQSRQLACQEHVRHPAARRPAVGGSRIQRPEKRLAGVQQPRHLRVRRGRRRIAGKQGVQRPAGERQPRAAEPPGGQAVQVPGNSTTTTRTSCRSTETRTATCRRPSTLRASRTRSWKPASRTWTTPPSPRPTCCWWPPTWA